MLFLSKKDKEYCFNLLKENKRYINKTLFSYIKRYILNNTKGLFIEDIVNSITNEREFNFIFILSFLEKDF